MTGTAVNVISRKYDGTIRRSWPADLLEVRHNRLDLFGIFENRVEHAEMGVIEAGTLSYEYFWLDRWYSIFRFHEPSGSLRNYYCNINMPPTFTGLTVDYVDLDIDIAIWPDGRYQILDLDEFDQHCEHYRYPADVRSTALDVLGELVRMIEARELPV